jgi:hypothetical protein
VHLARLRKGQQTTVIDMPRKMILAGKPEAFLYTKQIIFYAHNHLTL